MQTNHLFFARAARRIFLGATVGALSAGALLPAHAQEPPSQPAPVPGAAAAAADSAISGSGATTGAGSDPISATTMMQATNTPASSGGSKSSGDTKQDAKTRAAARRRSVAQGAIEPWMGRRVLLLQPLQLGPGFNADRAFGQAILSRAEALLQEQLEATGKFSVIRAHRFSPLIQRALQEKRLTEAQADEAITDKKAAGPGQNPTREPVTMASATTFLNQFTFDQVPLIGEFALEEVRASGTAARPGVQAQVSARLYEVNNPIALKSPVLTSSTATRGRNNIERYLDASRDAFAAISSELTAPLEDVDLPRVESSPSSASSTRPTTGSATAPAMADPAAPTAATATMAEPITPAPVEAAPVEAAPAEGAAMPAQ